MPQQERKVKIALVQDSWHENPEVHRSSLRSKILEAAQKGAQLVLLQELTLHRYFGDCEKGDEQVLALAEEMYTGPTSVFCSQVAREANCYLVGSIFEKKVSVADGTVSNYYNTAIVFNGNGDLQFFTRKQHIPSGTGYNETFFFESGDSDYPVHDLGFIKLATPTCYDQWFPELARIYALKGAELIIYPTAIGSEPNFKDFDSSTMWKHIVSSHAIANGVFVAAINRVGFEGLITFYGNSFVCDPTGKDIVHASRDQPEVLVAELDFKVFEFWRGLFPLLKQRQPETYKVLCEPRSESLE